LNTFYKNLSMWLVIGLTMILLFNLFNKPQTPVTEMSYSDFLTSVESGAVSQVVIQKNEINGEGPGGKSFKVISPADPDLIPVLRKAGVNIRVKQQEETPWYITILISWFPMLLLIGVWIFADGRRQGDEFRQEPGPPAGSGQDQGDLPGRGRNRRGQG